LRLNIKYAALALLRSYKIVYQEKEIIEAKKRIARYEGS